MTAGRLMPDGRQLSINGPADQPGLIGHVRFISWARLLAQPQRFLRRRMICATCASGLAGFLGEGISESAVTSPTDDHPLRRRIDEHIDFASQSFGTPVEAYFALGLLDQFCDYAGAEAFAVRHGHRRAAGFVPAQNEAAI